MFKWIVSQRAVLIGALGSIATVVYQVSTGELTWAAALPIIIGAAIHPFVTPAQKVGL